MYGDPFGLWKWNCAMCGEVPGDSKWLRTVEVGRNKFKYQHALCGSYLGDAPAPGTTPPASQSEDIYKLNISPYPSPITFIPKSSGNKIKITPYPGSGIGGTQVSSPHPVAPLPPPPYCTCGHPADQHSNAQGSGPLGGCYICFGCVLYTPFPTGNPLPGASICLVCGRQTHGTDASKVSCQGYPLTAVGSTCIGCGCGPGDPHVDHQGVPCPRRQTVLRTAGLIP